MSVSHTPVPGVPARAFSNTIQLRATWRLGKPLRAWNRVFCCADLCFRLASSFVVSSTSLRAVLQIGVWPRDVGLRSMRVAPDILLHAAVPPLGFINRNADRTPTSSRIYGSALIQSQKCLSKNGPLKSPSSIDLQPT
jgi:hypothetical protein